MSAANSAFSVAADRCASRCGQPGLRPVRGAFPAGPISQILIEDAINAALASGKASILSVHELGGRKTMRITGGLSASCAAISCMP
jgi:UDP-N-acetylmuramyl pentapeptide synthase